MSQSTAVNPEDMALAFAQNEQLVNSLSGLCDQLRSEAGFLGRGNGNTVSSTDTMFYNLRWYLVSNLRQLLSQIYVEHGIVQTLVDQPVDDAFRAGYELKTSQLDANDVEQLKIFDERFGVTRSLMQGRKWARLYGGGAVLIITNQDPKMPLSIDKITPDSPLEFRPVDMWELYFTQQNTSGDLTVGHALGENMGEYYDYYGVQIHTSRVKRLVGKEAPAFIKPRLRGWGMSELERLVRSLNQYLKNQDVIFELLDEAKVDVYRIKGFTSSLLNSSGTQATAARIQMANQVKNFTNGLVMDVQDEYEQKQINFSGLNDMLLQIRQGIAADLKMPMTKLFGISSAGFNSGEDDIENYNSMLESEIRAKDRCNHIDLLQIACRKVFGTTVDDMMLEYNPLRILNAKEEEEVKDSQMARVTSAYQMGWASAQQAKESVNKDSLLGVELDEKSDALPPPTGAADDESVKPVKGSAGKKTPQQD